MKNFLLVIILILSLIYEGNAQFTIGSSCIDGLSDVSIGDQITLQSNNNAQCTNCYDWDVSSGLSIVGSDTQQIVIIEGITNGSHTVTLTYLTENGCVTCSKTITVNNCEEIPNNLANTLVNNYMGVGNDYFGEITLNLPSGYDTSIIESIVWSLDSPNGYITNNNDDNLGNPYTSDPPVYSVGYVLNSEPQLGDDILFSVTVNFTSKSGCPSQILNDKLRIDRSMDLVISNFNQVKIISVYPNPISSEYILIDIENAENKNLDFKVFDLITGKELHYLKKNNIKARKFTEKISIENITSTSSLLLLEIYDNGKVIYSEKIVNN